MTEEDLRQKIKDCLQQGAQIDYKWATEFEDFAGHIEKNKARILKAYGDPDYHGDEIITSDGLALATQQKPSDPNNYDPEELFLGDLEVPLPFLEKAGFKSGDNFSYVKIYYELFSETRIGAYFRMPEPKKLEEILTPAQIRVFEEVDRRRENGPIEI